MIATIYSTRGKAGCEGGEDGGGGNQEKGDSARPNVRPRESFHTTSLVPKIPRERHSDVQGDDETERKWFFGGSDEPGGVKRTCLSTELLLVRLDNKRDGFFNRPLLGWQGHQRGKERIICCRQNRRLLL